MSNVVIPQQAETQVEVAPDGNIVIWQEGLNGGDEATIYIHRIFWPMFRDAVEAAVTQTA